MTFDEACFDGGYPMFDDFQWESSGPVLKTLSSCGGQPALGEAANKKKFKFVPKLVRDDWPVDGADGVVFVTEACKSGSPMAQASLVSKLEDVLLHQKTKSCSKGCRERIVAKHFDSWSEQAANRSPGGGERVIWCEPAPKRFLKEQLIMGFTVCYKRMHETTWKQMEPI